MTTFRLPDLGEGLTEAEIVAWHVSVGDHVTTDQPLVSVETDKAVVEIPSPHSGTVTKLHGAPGDIVETGAALVEIDTGTAKDAGAVVGELEAGQLAAKVPAKSPARTPAPAPRVSAAPAVRRRAQELGVDLAAVTGSGPGGAILTADVEAAAGGMGEPLRGVRRAMAKAMAASGAAVVPATITDEADIGAWGADETPMLRLVRALSAACAAEPALNAWFDGARRVLKERVDLTIAVDTPDGLFAPVLRGADRLSPDQLAARLTEIRTAVETRSIAPEALKGGTITLSNFGMMGGTHAVLVVAPPQVAILGAGRIHDAVRAVAGKPAVRRVLPLSLSFDHRVVAGGEAARFLQIVIEDISRSS